MKEYMYIRVRISDRQMQKKRRKERKKSAFIIFFPEFFSFFFSLFYFLFFIMHKEDNVLQTQHFTISFETRSIRFDEEAATHRYIATSKIFLTKLQTKKKRINASTKNKTEKNNKKKIEKRYVKFIEFTVTTSDLVGIGSSVHFVSVKVCKIKFV